MSKLGVDQYTGNTYARDRKIKQVHVHVLNPVQVMSCFYISFQVILAQVPFISSYSSGFFLLILSLYFHSYAYSLTAPSPSSSTPFFVHYGIYFDNKPRLSVTFIVTLPSGLLTIHSRCEWTRVCHRWKVHPLVGLESQTPAQLAHAPKDIRQQFDYISWFFHASSMLSSLSRIASANICFLIVLPLVLPAWVVRKLVRLAATNHASIERRSWSCSTWLWYWERICPFPIRFTVSFRFFMPCIWLIFGCACRYLLGQCLGGIIFPSFSEAFGRKRLYIISTGLYSVFCVVVGLSSSLAGIAVGRFFSGFLSAIPTIVVAGSIEDLYNSKDRIWMIFLWAMVANMGMCIGPIISTYIAEHLGW